jgi:CRP-like cAMP-binding protein
MEQIIKIIRQSVLFGTLPAEEIRKSLEDGSFILKTYGKNQVVHFVGDHCTRLEVILSGRVAVDRIDEAGNLMAVADFGPNDILGGNLIFSKKPFFPMTITARQPATILEIRKDRLFELCASHPDFLRHYLEYISDHAAILGNRIRLYVNRSIRQSIVHFLEQERKLQASDHIKLTASKKALAEKFGVARTSLSRELAKMKQEGLILYDHHSVTLLKDPDRPASL